METGKNDEVNALKVEIQRISLIKQVDELRIIRMQDYEKAIIVHVLLTDNVADYEKKNGQQSRKEHGSRLGH